MLDKVTVRSADGFGELAAHPERVREANSATVIVGTGSYASQIQMLYEIAKEPDVRQRLEELADSLIEEEFAYAMAILDPDDTGITTNNLWFQPAPGIQHGPRIKVMIDPAFAVRPGGKQATVPIDPTKKAEGDISPALERQVRDFIALNLPVLIRYWNLEYSSTKKFLADLKPIPQR
jgi:hypothetical protein